MQGAEVEGGGLTRAFFVSSALAFASAELLTSAIHELGHGLMAQALGFAPKIYAFYEDNPTGTAGQTLAILAAGPVFSLITGAAFWTWYLRAKPRYSYARLLLLWLALMGVTTFVNYLIVTPWLAAGDTAQFADILHWPTAARYGLTAVGIAMVIHLGRPAATAMARVAPQGVSLDSARAWRRYVMAGFYLPLLAGVLLTAVAGIGGQPIIVFYGLLATVGYIDVVVAALYGGPPAPRDDASRGVDAPLRVPPQGVAVYAALVLVYVFVFSRGLPV